MQLSHELVQNFQALHRKKYGEDISYDIAELQLNELADLVRKTSPKQESTKNDESI